MIWILLGIILLPILVRSDLCNKEESIGEVIMQYIFFGIMGSILGLLVAVVFPGDSKTVEQKYEIISLSDNSHLEGDFFLGIGSIKNDLNYAFYYKTQGGFYKLKTLSHQNVVIQYTDKSPVLVKRTQRQKVNYKIWYALDLREVRNNNWIIKVPPGTIKNNFKLDLK